MNELLVMYSLNDTVKVVVGGSYLHIKRENLDEPAVVEVCPRHRPSPLRDTSVVICTLCTACWCRPWQPPWSPIHHSSWGILACGFAAARLPLLEEHAVVEEVSFKLACCRPRLPPPPPWIMMLCFSLIMGAFITQISNTPGLCITMMHTAIQFTNPKKEKIGKIHIDSEQL
jgi:hypothetical protein